jgi:hypothetical protein
VWGQNESMCGRYVMSKVTGDLLSHFEAKAIEGSPPPSWNVAPTQDVPIIAERVEDDSLDRRLLIARWGLVPSWSKDIKIGSKLINARSGSILDKPSFRKAAIKRRALVPAEGYYEWQKTEDGKKIPNYLYSEKEELLAFAGLYEFWPDRSRAAPFIVAGHGWIPRGDCSHRSSSRGAAVFKGVDLPTIRSSPSRASPATTSRGSVIGPMTPPQMIPRFRGA